MTQLTNNKLKNKIYLLANSEKKNNTLSLKHDYNKYNLGLLAFYMCFGVSFFFLSTTSYITNIDINNIPLIINSTTSLV